MIKKYNGKKDEKKRKITKKKIRKIAKKKQIRYPCAVCEREVGKGGSMQCSECWRYCHLPCTGLEGKEDYKKKHITDAHNAKDV